MNKIVLVLGGHGFIGKAIVKELRKHGHEVIIGTRAHDRSLRPGERRIKFHTACADQWNSLLNGCDVVINAVGILRQRWRESYEQVHHNAVHMLANSCQQNDVRLIHVSALGLDADVKSRFLTSKRLGERAIKQSKGNWLIVRPSLLEGNDGYGAPWFRKIAQWPIHCTPANAKGRIAPLHVNKLAESIVLLVNSNNSQEIHEYGGEHTFTFKSYLNHLAKKKPILHLSLPGILVRMVSHLFDLLHITPLSFGHYELMLSDNLPSQ